LSFLSQKVPLELKIMQNQEKLSFEYLCPRNSGALLASAAGDAMGWMTEFIRSPEDLNRKMGVVSVTQYYPWSKQVGGRFQGYEDQMNPGDYSDDTQLTISTAACIKPDGKFDYNAFCNAEYPQWLEYARGGGSTVKEAAVKIQRQSASWNNNFFKRKVKDESIDYRDGGANGAAMRISPHVFANANNWPQAEVDIWRNSIISHGHPTAIIGSVLYGYGLYLALRWSQDDTGVGLIETLGKWVKDLEIPKLSDFRPWLSEWNKGRAESFDTVFNAIKQEAVNYLRLVYKGLQNEESPSEVMKQLGCFGAKKGSGLSTAIAGIYLFARQPKLTQENIIIATNMIGTDTDSIAAFTGGLGGAAFGKEAIPSSWQEQVQDAQFLLNVGEYLASVAAGAPKTFKIRPGMAGIKWKQKLSRLDVKDNLTVVHNRFGLGKVIKVSQQSLLTKDKTVTIITIKFDVGQSCTFAFRSDAKSDTLFLV